MKLDSHALASRALERGGPVLVSGAGKMAFVAELTDAMVERQGAVTVFSADLGSPSFGVPGAVGCAHRTEHDYHLRAIAGLATLDAARFRLPLVVSLSRLVERVGADFFVVEAPAIDRGMAAAELIASLVDVLNVGTAIVLSEDDGTPSFLTELTGRDVDILRAPSDRDEPRRAQRRAERRTRLWDAYLRDASEVDLAVELPLAGAPPPLDAAEAWPGRQVALVDRSGRTLAMGEVRGIVDGNAFRIVAPSFERGAVRKLVVRDARRSEEGLLQTDRGPSESTTRVVGGAIASDLRAEAAPEPEPLRPPVADLASMRAILVNGIFGDPLLHLRLRHERRSLLFDLGDTGRLPARILHQVTDVFVSHAHFDHIAGFIWLLRSSLGHPRLLRLYGPPGMTANIEGMIAGIHWDRIGDRAPRFEIVELDGDTVRRSLVTPGAADPQAIWESKAPSGRLLEAPGFAVCATTLDHAIPVLAFAFEESRQFHVRKDKLIGSGLSPGPWLSELKNRLHRNEGKAPVRLPDGREKSADELARDLVLVRPGKKLVYATDLDDNEGNRERLTAFARGAFRLFCEASFVEADRAQARNTQHLTARACGEIAAAAGVEALVPFHFSKRYERQPEIVYREVMEAFPRVLVPKRLADKLESSR